MSEGKNGGAYMIVLIIVATITTVMGFAAGYSARAARQPEISKQERLEIVSHTVEEIIHVAKWRVTTMADCNNKCHGRD